MSRPQRIGWWGAVAAAAVLYLVLQVAPFWGSDPVTGAPRTWQNDFKHIYLGSMLLADGESPYDRDVLIETAALFSREEMRFQTILPFVYPPFTGIVLRPLAALDFDSAVHVWMALNHVLIVGGVLLAMHAAGWRADWAALAFAAGALLLNFTLYRQTNAGQLNGVLLFGFAAVYWLVRREPFGARASHWTAGGLAAALALFKLTPGILLLWFLLRRRWTEALAMGVGLVVLLAASIAVAGWQPHAEFLSMLPEMGYGQSTWAEDGHTFWRDPFNQSPNAFLHQVLVPIPEAPGAESAAAWADRLTMGISLLLLALFAAATWKRGGQSDANGESADDATFALAILLSLLIPSLCWDHYLIQGLVAAAILWKCFHGSRSILIRVLCAIAVALWVLPLSAPAGWIAWWFAPEVRLNLPATPIVSSLKLWPTLLLFLAACGALVVPRRAGNSAGATGDA